MNKNIHHITSTSNPHVASWKKLLTDNQSRRKEGRVVIEGKNLIQDLMKKGVVETLIMTDKMAQVLQNSNQDIPTFIVTEHVYKAFSQLEHPEGLAGIAKIPTQKSLLQAKKLLILDRLQDPGNVGTLLRTALAFGIEHVMFLAPSCDPWNEKVVRSAKGAHFELSLHLGSLQDLQHWSETNSASIYVADLRGAPSEALRNHPSCFGLVLSNEGSGPDPRLLSFCQPVTIEMNPAIESLNVAQAGSILLYLLYDKN